LATFIAAGRRKTESMFLKQHVRPTIRVSATVLLLLAFMVTLVFGAQPEEVTFPSGKLMLHGFLYRPAGSGPFPTILYNHGSERQPGPKAVLAQLFSSAGYVFFLPHRRSHGRSPNDSFVDSLYDRGAAGIVALHEIHLDDQLAALSYLRQLPFVDPNRIAVAGCSYGGIQTILAVEANAEQKLGLRAAIDFAGGAMSWRSLSLRNRMVRAVRKATIPVLFIQAENDYDLGPSRTLTNELEQLRKPHKLLIFPPFGQTHQEGHSFCGGQGGDIWGPAVFSFLDAAMGQ
jgi:carboxymethylenebutenolidase